MKIFTKLLAIGIIFSFVVINFLPTGIASYNSTDIPINRSYFIAQLNGEIIINDTFSYNKSILPDRYKNIEINGTVTNSTLLNPFSIWPPISIIPGLRMLFLTDNSSIHITINYFKGKFYLKNDNSTIRFYGMGLITNVTAILKI